MADEDELSAAASNPGTPQATLADLAYDHPELRADIALNPSTYDGLIEWLAALDDPAVNAALDIRTRGITEIGDPGILRLHDAPEDTLGTGREPLQLSTTEPSRSVPTLEGLNDGAEKSPRWPAFITKRFAIIIGSLTVLLIVGIVIGVSAHNAALDAEAAAEFKAQQAAADKANAASATDNPSPTPTETTSSTPTETPAPLPPSIVPSGFAQTWSQGFVATGGYTETVAVSVGTPESLGAAYPRQVSTGSCSSIGLSGSGCTRTTFTSGHSCTANKTTDAVVPISVDSTSTTSAFSQVVGARLTFQSSSQLQYEAYYDSGPVCNDGSSGGLAESSMSTKSLKSGEGTTLPMFLIIENYYTPDHPHGDPSMLAGIVIYVAGATTSSTAWAGDGNPVTHQTIGSASSTLPAGSPLRLG